MKNNHRQEHDAVGETNCSSAGVEQALQPLTFADTVSPCGHNDWQTLRVKRGFITTLQCRHCLSTWKLPRPMRMACRTFHVNGGKCPLGASCPYIHLSRPKARQQHPPGFLEIVNRKLRNAAISVLSDLGVTAITPDVAGEAYRLYAAEQVVAEQQMLSAPGWPPMDPMDAALPTPISCSVPLDANFSANYAPTTGLLPLFALDNGDKNVDDEMDALNPLPTPVVVQRLRHCGPPTASCASSDEQASFNNASSGGTGSPTLTNSSSRLLPITNRYKPSQRRNTSHKASAPEAEPHSSSVLQASLMSL